MTLTESPAIGPEPSPTRVPLLPPARETAALWALLFGNFVVGTGVLMPAGMLTDLAGGLSVSLPTAGALLIASGLIVCIGAPLLAALTSRADRRLLLTAALVLYAITHAASALSADYNVIFALRFVMAVSAAIFTPQAASTVGAMLPPERRSAAITMIFVGWSLATVGGMPLGGLVAHTFGWQTAFAIVAVLSIVGAAAVWLTLPGKLRIAPLDRASWGSVLSNKALMTVLLVTVLNGTGQFTFLTYLNPSLKVSLGADATLVTLVLAWYGISATAGNVAATRAVGAIGAPRAALISLLAMTFGMIIWALGAASMVAVFAAATLWGFGTFATNSVQQARLAGIAPQLASASIALNTSAIYFGQAAGSGLGGALVNAGALAYLPLAGAAILALAAAVSVIAGRYEKASVQE